MLSLGDIGVVAVGRRWIRQWDLAKGSLEKTALLEKSRWGSELERRGWKCSDQYADHLRHVTSRLAHLLTL